MTRPACTPRTSRRSHPRSPLLQMALRLHKLYDRPYPPRPQRRLEGQVETVLYYSRLLTRQLQLLQQARCRGWSVAADCCQRRLAESLRNLHYAASEATACAPLPDPAPAPALRLLYDELAALDQEFQTLQLTPDSISVSTDPITLEDVELGPFEIHLSLSRLIDHPDSSAFTILALDPNPAAANPSTVHPHVSDSQLCAGEATVPISAALAEGRLSDAFACVSAVLHTYNPASPYVALSEWQGSSCCDCGRTVPDDERCTCEGCEQDYCCSCISICDGCDSSFCRDCLEEDPHSGRLVCASCRKQCSRCSRTVDPDSFDDESELCPQCKAEQDEQQEQEDQEEQQEGQGSLQSTT